MDTIETSIYTAVLISGVVLAIIFFYFGFTIIRRQRKHFEIQRAHFLDEIARLDAERNRIASDLHDELGPLLSITRIEVSEIQTEDAESLQLQQRAYKRIDEVTERLGGIAKNLIPRKLLQKGLKAALTEFFDQYQEVTPIKLELEYRVKQALQAPLKLQVYRMVQEIVHNAVKHSGGSKIEVVLYERKGWLYVYCKDDGKGIKEKNMDKSTGLGMQSLRNRATMLGGRMQYFAEKGAEYFIEIPINDSL